MNTLEPDAFIGSATQFIIELLAHEVDSVKLAIGQKTLVTLDAFGTKAFEAEISRI